jgi:hypothetical protein
MKGTGNSNFIYLWLQNITPPGTLDREVFRVGDKNHPCCLPHARGAEHLKRAVLKIYRVSGNYIQRAEKEWQYQSALACP